MSEFGHKLQFDAENIAVCEESEIQIKIIKFRKFKEQMSEK
jgi:hypothetical protein